MVTCSNSRFDMRRDVWLPAKSNAIAAILELKKTEVRPLQWYKPHNYIIDRNTILAASLPPAPGAVVLPY